MGSINAGNNWLMLLTSEHRSQVETYPVHLYDRTDILSSLNTNDIESITVIKDVAAALFTARAANGVVVITTKSGKQGKQM